MTECYRQKRPALLTVSLCRYVPVNVGAASKHVGDIASHGDRAVSTNEPLFGALHRPPTEHSHGPRLQQREGLRFTAFTSVSSAKNSPVSLWQGTRVCADEIFIHATWVILQPTPFFTLKMIPYGYISCGRCNKSLHTWWLKTTALDSLMLSQRWRPEAQHQGVGRAVLPSQAPREHPSSPLPSSQAMILGLWRPHSSLCLHLHMDVESLFAFPL